MKVKMISMSIATAMTLQVATASNAYAKIDLGGIIGAIAGGALCSNFGKGNGKTAWIILCAVGGNMIGSEIQKNMDEADARAYEDAQRRSFDGGMNQDYGWGAKGDRGPRGTLRPTRDGYHSRTREVCREFSSVSYYGSQREEKRGFVCKRSNGEFYSVEEREVSFNGRVVESERRETVGTTTPNPMPRLDVRPMDPPPRYDSRRDYDDSTIFSNLSRAAGGDKYRVSFDRAIRLNEISIVVTNGSFKVRRVVADLVTRSGMRYSKDLRQLESNYLLSGRDSLRSTELMNNDYVTGLTFILEGYGYDAQARISVTSDDQVRMINESERGNRRDDRRDGRGGRWGGR